MFATVKEKHMRVKTTERTAWKSPKLEELGRLRDFVRVGNAFGKSVVVNDGNSEAGGESMAMNN